MRRSSIATSPPRFKGPGVWILAVAVAGAVAAVLAVTAVALVAPGPAWALGERTTFAFAMLRVGSAADARAPALSRLAWETAKRTSVEVLLEPRNVVASDRALIETPFAVLAAHEPLPRLDEAGLANLRRFVLAGGLLLVDGAPAGDAAARALIADLFGAGKLVRVPENHVIYHSFYLLDGPYGRLQTAPYLEGVFVDDRLAVVYSRNDLLGALMRDGGGAWTYTVEGGNKRRERAYRLGINLVMYALCLDYKDDQVHLPFILKRRR
jgi:hypothetical protein